MAEPLVLDEHEAGEKFLQWPCYICGRPWCETDSGYNCDTAEPEPRHRFATSPTQDYYRAVAHEDWALLLTILKHWREQPDIYFGTDELERPQNWYEFWTTTIANLAKGKSNIGVCNDYD